MSYAVTSSEGLRQARAMWTALQAANTLADLDRLYQDWIGYSVIADDPQAEADCVRDTLADYVREFCASLGVHFLDACLDDDAFVGPMLPICRETGLMCATARRVWWIDPDECDRMSGGVVIPHGHLDAPDYVPTGGSMSVDIGPSSRGVAHEFVEIACACRGR